MCALAVIATIFGLVVHACSFVGIILLPGRNWQRGVGWGLFLLLVLETLYARRRGTSLQVAYGWSILWLIVVANAAIYAVSAPAGGVFQSPNLLKELGLGSLDAAVFYARESSATHIALGLSLFLLTRFGSPIENRRRVR